MSPGCMLLFVFGFVGGAVVINSAVLVSLSVLLLVHYSVSNGLPAITHSLPRISRYAARACLFWRMLAYRLSFAQDSFQFFRCLKYDHPNSVIQNAAICLNSEKIT